MDELYKLLQRLVMERFFGIIEVKFEAGNITIVRKTETIKLH